MNVYNLKYTYKFVPSPH